MDAVARHLTKHHGVIARAEALELGMSERTISRRVTTGRWTMIGRGVYRLAGAPATWLGDARAAALSVDGLISHRGAARVQRIEGYEHAPIEVTVDYLRRPLASGDFRIYRSKQVRLAGGVERDRVPVTGLPRTVLDLAAVEPPERLDEVVSSLLRDNRIAWHALVGVLVRHSRQGRNGCGGLRELIDRRFGEKRPPGSAFNAMVADLLRDAGLEPVHEYELFDGDQFVARVDVAFVDQRVAVELDGRATHDNPISFVEDRRRANRIVNLGWHLLTFSWDDFRDRPDELVATVRKALSTRPAPAGSPSL